MTDDDSNRIYRGLLKDAEADKNIAGVILAGSRARCMQNANSDWDVYIIFNNVITSKEIDDYKKSYWESYKDFKLDISNKALQTVAEFSHYAELDSDYYWDRYNLVHAKLEIDKTNGEIIRLLSKINTVTPREQKQIVDFTLGDYISLVYRSMKSYELGKLHAAIVDAAESIRFMLTSLFAFYSRVRPFNKYLEWEINNYPLADFKWDTNEFMEMLSKIIRDADMAIQQKLYLEIEKMARARGFGYKYDAWGEKIKYVNNQNFSDK